MHLRKCFLLLTCLLVVVKNSIAQTCTGSLGDPIVNISFGAGANYGPPLQTGATSSLQYQGANCPSDGYYSIVNYTSGCWASDVVWHTATDHTGNSNGYYMLINASNQPSNFYIQTINGLCAETTYQFAAWLLNMCSVMGINPNITFTIEKTDGTILGTYDTGDIPIINPVTWAQYGFYFTTPPNVSSVVLRMRNNSPGGVGNDLGLDDITFRPAGPAIDAKITGNTGDTINVCADNNSSFHFESTVENCYAATAYQWQLSTDNGNTWGNISGATSNAYTRISTDAGTYLYRLTAAETINIGISTCRVSSNPITIIVNPLPVTSVTSNGAKCSGDSIVLNATGGSVYNWTGPNTFTATGSQIIVKNVTVANSGKYYVMVTTAAGCKKLDSTTVAVYPSPVAAFGVTAPVCEKSAVLFSDQSVTGGQPIQKWNWDFGDGGVATTKAPTHIFTDKGNYVVSLSVENDKGCNSNVVTKNILANPLPHPDFILPAICLADPFATFINTSSISDGSEGQFTYAWNFGDVNAAPALNVSAQQSPKHAYTSVGIYPVDLKIISKDGCIKDTIKNFTVNGSQPIAKFTIDPSVNFCSNSDIIFADAASVNFGSITKSEIYWDFINNPTAKITDSLPATGKQYSHLYNSFAAPLTKQIQVKYVVYSGVSCVNETTQMITLKASPEVQFTALQNVCAGVEPFLLNQGTEINGMSGTGIYSGAGVNASGLFDASIATAGDHIIRYTFTASNKCTAFAEQSIKVFEQPVVNAGPDRTLLLGSAIVLNASASGSNLQYEWIPNTAIENNLVLTPTISPVINTTYTLKVLSADGCKAGDEVLVTVVKDIFVPTAFSPNGDGLNDVWRIPYLDSYTGASLDVFDRYGQIVFHSTDLSIGWNGKFKGKSLPTGSYPWVLHPGSGRKLMYGMVSIVR
ncbi:MAG: type sorting protein [Ferruginibacter sp.]|uniref:PKD domain-containing protein n=1 Tax=Ferruginibacter sp. TaxID=1940288 RepID=UPI0026599BFC|nr:PKD domain-containing protein [Ferruginibacter sp.]MDB5278746.1 type sorting protein [Ferruginibacter sp.]